MNFFWVFNLVLLLMIQVHAAADDGLITAACKKAVAESPKVNYDFCVSSLEADPKSNTYDIFALSVESYKHLLEKENSIKSYINKLLKDGKQSPEVKLALDGCSQDYSDTTEPTEDALASFRARDYNASFTLLQVILGCLEHCTDRFDGKITSPLEKEENEFFQLIVISNAITEMALDIQPLS
ncbi:hypothetical protein MKW94_003693 [Papaver nudicaule]|uniref:Pectinesterase inhibitor domain-containing protein n=1 Tax=Papaver nudicaule TaxID=74823 RepID=A0AA42B5R9_PAPNU|nr:hypothetical protein [Papaver nudicaule]